MDTAAPPKRRNLRQSYMVAVVLGTALTALASTPGTAKAAPEATLRAVNDISRYCTACWRNAGLHPGCWTDCTQEVFSRLLERVTPEAWAQLLHREGEERRELVRAIDTVKKRTQRSKRWSSNLLETAVDYRERQDQRRADDLDAVKQAAVELLSPRQQRVLQLSLEGWSVKDIADELDTTVERVSDEKYKAVRKLRAHLNPEGADVG